LRIDENSLAPIYVQIADAIEEDILNDKLQEGGSCYSQLVIAKELKVNPATAAKGINLLVSRGILEKQRGMAMIIRRGARELIIQRKKQTDFEFKIEELVRTARQLNLTQDYVTQKIAQYYRGNPI
jgi:DNA-binding transcriptional regulator YhcF (GntR family)